MEESVARKRERVVRDDFDSPWKVYFRQSLSDFLAFVDEETYFKIDWSREPEFLDKELRRISRGLRRNTVFVDFLAKVWLKDGAETILLIHVEFQSQKDVTLPERIFVYNTRAYDLCRKPVLSYALLADEISDWKPESFGFGSGASSSTVTFNALKLKDYFGREEELERSDNPFALAILAHIKTLQTRGEAQARYDWKVSLFRMLLSRGWKRPATEALLYFIDWLMQLPAMLENRFDDRVEEEFEENPLELISPREKRNVAKAIKAGLVDVLQHTLIDTLNYRFKSISETLESLIFRIEDEVI